MAGGRIEFSSNRTGHKRSVNAKRALLLMIANDLPLKFHPAALGAMLRFKLGRIPTLLGAAVMGVTYFYVTA